MTTKSRCRDRTVIRHMLRMSGREMFTTQLVKETMWKFKLTHAKMHRIMMRYGNKSISVGKEQPCDYPGRFLILVPINQAKENHQ